MKKRRVWRRMTALLILIIAASAPEPSWAASRRVELMYEILPFPSTPGARVDIWLPVPTTGPDQDVGRGRSVWYGEQAVVREPDYGNALLHATTVLAGPRMPGLIAAWQITRLGPIAGDGTPLKRHLQPHQKVPALPEVKNLAATVSVGYRDSLGKAHAIYDYVRRTMTYDKSVPGYGQGDVRYALQTHKGNCTDFHSLFLAMCRSQGVPARFIMGASLNTDATGQGFINGYHCWAEFHDGTGWEAVDLTRGPAFGTLDGSDRVRLSVGRDVLLPGHPRKRRVNYLFGPYIEVNGVPYPDPPVRLTYQDLR